MIEPHPAAPVSKHEDHVIMKKTIQQIAQRVEEAVK
jgi:hypothetical protein